MAALRRTESAVKWGEERCGVRLEAEAASGVQVQICPCKITKEAADSQAPCEARSESEMRSSFTFEPLLPLRRLAGFRQTVQHGKR